MGRSLLHDRSSGCILIISRSFTALIADGGLKLCTSPLKCLHITLFVFSEEVCVLVHESHSVLFDFSVEFFKSLCVLVSHVVSQS